MFLLNKIATLPAHMDALEEQKILERGCINGMV